MSAAVVDLARVRAGLGRLRAATAASTPTQRERVASWFQTYDGAPTMPEPTPPPPTVTVTVRLAPEDLAELEAVAAELARTLPASRFAARLNRSTVGAAALVAGLVVLRREHGLSPRGAPPEDPRQARFPGT